jgi:anti-sigma factor RsiW
LSTELHAVAEETRRRARDYVLGRLSEAERLSFEDHVAGCAECAVVVLEVEGGMERLESAMARAASAGWTWSRVVEVVFGPVPAAVYLASAALLAFVLLFNRASLPIPAQLVAVLEPAGVRVEGDALLRGSVGEALPALEIPAGPMASGPRVLELETRVDRADIEDPSAAFVVEVADAGQVLVSLSARREHFGPRGTLRLALDPTALPRGRELTVLVRLDKPGDPFHGKALFSRLVLLR